MTKIYDKKISINNNLSTHCVDTANWATGRQIQAVKNLAPATPKGSFWDTLRDQAYPG